MHYRGEEWTMVIDGNEWRGRQWGQENGFPILALPGWLDHAASFDALAPLLNQQFYILALDLLGQGLSSHLPDDQSYELRFEVLRLEKLIKTLQWPHYGILAHSRGGSVGVLLTAMMTSAVKGLVLLDSLGPLSAQIYEASDTLKTFHQKMTARSQQHKHTVYPTLEDVYASRSKVNTLTPTALETLESRGLEKVKGGYSWRFDLRLLHPTEHLMEEDAVLNCMANITCPVLLMRAAQGLLVQHPILTKRKMQFKHFKEVSVEGTHYVHLNTPQNISEHINEFFQMVQTTHS
jgi:pimeloyl-ACP methyl ester carboxylesterase